jgi:Tfp pilus assembly protein PilE
MGCLFVLVLGGATAAAIFLFGYAPWVLLVLGALWLAAVIYSLVAGHHGFSGGGNTDLMMVLAGLFVGAAIMIPNYNAQKPCAQAKTALAKFAAAEREYFSAHETYTADLTRLNVQPNPQVSLSILRGDDESFAATATHASCNNEADGTPTVFLWDSAQGGLQ